MRRHPFDSLSATALLATLLVSGCDSDPNEPEICDSAVTVIQPSGLQPSFAWSPECGIASLSVTTPVVTQFGVQARVVWAVDAPADQLSAPLPYGSLPWGASVLVSPDSLLPGRDYRVTLRRWVVVDGRRQQVDVGNGHWRS